MLMFAAVDRLCSNYDSSMTRAATVSDGQNDWDPSHGSYLASQSHAFLSAMSRDYDDDESADDESRVEAEERRKQKGLMDQRNAE
jgi:hypothetical protein